MTFTGLMRLSWRTTPPTASGFYLYQTRRLWPTQCLVSEWRVGRFRWYDPGEHEWEDGDRWLPLSALVASPEAMATEPTDAGSREAEPQAVGGEGPDHGIVDGVQPPPEKDGASSSGASGGEQGAYSTAPTLTATMATAILCHLGVATDYGHMREAGEILHRIARSGGQEDDRG